MTTFFAVVLIVASAVCGMKAWERFRGHPSYLMPAYLFYLFIFWAAAALVLLSGGIAIINS